MYGGHTIEKVTQQFGVHQQLSHSVYGQLKDFLGLLLDSDHGVESENVNFSTWGSITRVIDYFLFITVVSFMYIPSTPQQIIVR